MLSVLQEIFIKYAQLLKWAISLKMFTYKKFCYKIVKLIFLKCNCIRIFFFFYSEKVTWVCTLCQKKKWLIKYCGLERRTGGDSPEWGSLTPSQIPRRSVSILVRFQCTVTLTRNVLYVSYSWHSLLNFQITVREKKN